MTKDKIKSDQTNTDVVNEKSGSFMETINLAYPLMISFLSFSIMGLVDILILGKVGTPEQGGAGLGMSLTWTCTCLFAGTMTVVTTFIAQSNGAGKQEVLYRYVVTALTMIVPMTLIIWSIIPFVPFIVGLMNTSKDVEPFVVDYMSIRLIGSTFILINFTMAGFLRGLADTKTPMVITILSNIINIVMDIILVFGTRYTPAMGVKGAALASVIATFCAVIMYSYIYLNRANAEKYNTRKWVWVSYKEISHFLKIGLPIGASWLVESISWAIMAIYIASIDSAGIAAHIIVMQIIQFSFMPTVAISVACSTLVGQYLGAERVDLAKRSAKMSILFGLGLMGFVGVLFAVFRVEIVGLFSVDQSVIKLGSGLLLIAAAFQLFDALSITVGGVLRGAGDTRFPLYVQLGSAWLVFIPLVYVFGKVLGLGVYGAWLASLVFVILLGIMMLSRFIGGKWAKIRVV